ncbi:MAG: elongation factor P [Candidatus Gracilibacteria bacterium]|nr:elongation factor P [Candidatus Gracilibacteria bacterium]
MKTAFETRPGCVVEIDGDLYFVTKWESHRGGRGATTVKMRLKNIGNGSMTDKVYSSDDKLDDVILERTVFEYLYNSSGVYVFMNSENYEQVELSEDDVGDMKYFLSEGATIDIQQHNGNFVGIILATYMKLKVVEALPLVGSSENKEVITNTGLKLEVPPFIEEGDEIVVNTSTFEFVDKVK